MLNKLFKNEEIMTGIKTIKNSFKSIDNTLADRGNEYGFKELSSYTEELKKLRTPRTNGISINDIYSFENGKLSKITDNNKQFSFNIGSNSSYYPTIVRENDYSYMLENTVGLSSVNFTTDFMFGGLNYAFRNCINLRTAAFNIKNVEFEVLSGRVWNDGSHTELYNAMKQNGFAFNPSANTSKFTLKISYIYWEYNKYCDYRVSETNITTSQLLYKAFDGCTSFEKLSFPSINREDIVINKNTTCPTCNGKGQVNTGDHTYRTCSQCDGNKVISAPWFDENGFIDYFGLNSVSSDVIFEFKDGTFNIENLING